ncbi:UDP-glucose/GDP-mannose dehydrogenase family protein [Paenibacillus sp. IB182496]|uniref:UDP-glucose 6-dehydrogenase n=1 Tax=Paenibacillus sabuli TaxID=2772509 RepID=A0A927BUU4_9BACL|nr:UDP-glucose/GDP-mannose dehydrogenase family protein [Paenibacillus sabuli]MBD2845929.1 UDP-glucose/GDP-mannose dehydrogenase family protein [Paenibacillus sabuli]
MNIGVVGAGYVGLVTAVCLAEVGHNLKVVEVNAEKVEKLNNGECTIYEAGLTELLQNNIQAGRLNFTNHLTDMINDCEAIFLCVGTPPKEDGSADLSQIEAAVKEIVAQSNEGQYKLIVVKSTVPVGTADWLKEIVSSHATGRQVIEIASNPEFLREGVAVNDFMEPDRIILGVSSIEGKRLLEKLYEPFACPKIITDSNTAEVIKYAANSFLATKISFINMVSDLCEEVAADVSQVAEGMGYDKRIGPEFLKAGIGFGGSCFPKDLSAFLHVGQARGLNFGLLEQVISVNEERPARIQKKIESLVGPLKGKTIAFLGLAFKANTDDVRESPSAKLAALLKKEDVTIRATDPMASANFKAMYAPLAQSMDFFESAEETLKGSDCAVILTDWEHYKAIDWNKIKTIMNRAAVVDARNLYTEQNLRQLGYSYAGVGKELEKLEGVF